MNELKTPIQLRLTQFSKGSGCGCKIGPAVLEKILEKEGVQDVFPSLLVGNESKDDAAVLDLGNDQCLISTTDFFTPIVDDPFQFGKIAAVNALSDVYAMGGKPILALAILGFPIEQLPVDMAREIISGAKAVCREAGIPLAGGHSIDTPEPIFGLAVNGLVRKKNIRRNNTAREGDQLVLTKPLGIGILSAALKRGVIHAEDLDSAIRVMVKLNSIGEKFASLPGVHAMTDVTGFGFLGHLIEICEGSGVSARIQFKHIPLIDGIGKYVDQFIFPGGTTRNWNSFEKKVIGVNGPSFIPLCDPQTSGGLLVAVGKESLNAVRECMKQSGQEADFHVVGEITARKEYSVEVIE